MKTLTGTRLEDILCEIVRYMEKKHDLRINIRSIRSRIAAKREKSQPRASEAARLIQSFSSDQEEEPALLFQVEKTALSNTLCNI